MKAVWLRAVVVGGAVFGGALCVDVGSVVEDVQIGSESVENRLLSPNFFFECMFMLFTQIVFFAAGVGVFCA